MAKIARIYRYPIKGLSAEPLQAVELAAGEGVPLDRKFALARPDAPFDPERPAWLPKNRFLMLMTDERLATLRVAYDDALGRLTIAERGERGSRLTCAPRPGALRSSSSSRRSWAPS
jgi:uncharacterized protein